DAERELAAGECGEGEQDGGRVAGSAAEAGSHGDALGEPHLDTADDAHRVEGELGGAGDEVVRDGDRVGESDGGASRAGEGDAYVFPSSLAHHAGGCGRGAASGE